MMNFPIKHTYLRQIADEENTPAGVVNYPSDEGIQTDGSSILTIGYSAEDVTLSIQVSADRVNWIDITGLCESLSLAGIFGFGRVGGAVVIPDGAVLSDILQAHDVSGVAFIRLVADYPDATNSLEAYLGRR
jgi:hypothetical protein